MKSRWFKALLGLAVVSLLIVGVIGFAHTKAGRPLLAYMPWAPPGCPYGFDKVDPGWVEGFRQKTLAERDGQDAAKGRPALQFELGKTTEADVKAFTAARGDQCELTRQGSVYHCTNVVLDDGGPVIDDLHLQVDAAGNLVAVDAFRNGADAEATLTYYDRLAKSLTEKVGPVTKEYATSEADLRARSYRRAAREFRYSGYVATVSVMNYGKRGLRVREQYQYLPEEPHAMR
jgi:hypothetical protein